MGRKKEVMQTYSEKVTIIGAGITERWYFSHLQGMYGIKVRIRPRYFGNENITTLEKRTKQVVADGDKAIVVFDADVTTWNNVEKQRFKEFKQKYKNSKKVILCDSMPSIELWFLLHYINTTKYYGTSKAVINELSKYLEGFTKNSSYLEQNKWVEELCSNGRLKNATSRAEDNGEEHESYSNVWKAIKELGL